MRPRSVPCCGESGRARKSGHRRRRGTLTPPGQRRPIHPVGPRCRAHSGRRADPLRHRRPRPPPATRRYDRGNPRRRHHLRPGRRMARPHTRPLHDPPVNHRSRPRRPANRGRARHRRGVPPSLTLSGVLSGFAVNAAHRHDRRPQMSRSARSAPIGRDAFSVHRQCRTAGRRSSFGSKGDHAASGNVPAFPGPRARCADGAVGVLSWTLPAVISERTISGHGKAWRKVNFGTRRRPRALA
jgi:hypothetical protein